MGKGFNNYMCKKFFHPASRDNLKRVWMAEQKSESYKKKQEELRIQYEKEQDLYTNKAMLSKESKDKLSVNFMYEPPPGTKKEREREDDEPEYKFEWQRKFNAPREDYCKGDSEIRDQPFGIQVRNVRCIKCHKWGHINTDKECPMYNQASSSGQMGSQLDPLVLVQQMREDGLAMKRSALSSQQHVRFSHSQDLIPSEDEGEESKQFEIQYLRSLSVKQKRRLLRKLEKLEKKETNSTSNKKKMKKKKLKRKVRDSESDGSSSDSEESEKERKSHKAKKRVKKDKDKKRERHSKNVRVKKEPSSSSSDSELSESTLKKVLGRSIVFSGRNSRSGRVTVHRDGLPDRDCERSTGLRVRRDDAKHKPCMEVARRREDRPINGLKRSGEMSKESDERSKRRSTSEGEDSSHRKRQKQ